MILSSADLHNYDKYIRKYCAYKSFQLRAACPVYIHRSKIHVHAVWKSPLGAKTQVVENEVRAEVVYAMIIAQYSDFASPQKLTTDQFSNFALMDTKIGQATNLKGNVKCRRLTLLINALYLQNECIIIPALRKLHILVDTSQILHYTLRVNKTGNYIYIDPTCGKIMLRSSPDGTALTSKSIPASSQVASFFGLAQFVFGVFFVMLWHDRKQDMICIPYSTYYKPMGDLLTSALNRVSL